VNLVQAWRAPADGPFLWMRGVTTGYRADPVGEYIIGVAHGRAYQLRRGRSSHLVRPGQMVVLDPATAHSGSPAEKGAWAARMLVVELAGPGAAPAGGDAPLGDLPFPEPVIGDEAAVGRFLALHRAMEGPASALERQSAVLMFLAGLAAWSPGAARTPDAGPGMARTRPADPAVRTAVDYLRGDATRNISLDELAAVVGVGKYHLIRQFCAATGIPPHAYQIALRVNLARRLLERGERATHVATLAGFCDQSHLNRHFRRRLGLTPAQYARAIARR
jgi:AraC-like DNA-binding protein